MNRKGILTVALLAFVIASVASLIYKEFRPQGSSGNTDAVAMDKRAATDVFGPKKGHHVIAYYFHSTFRCTICFTMEQLTQEAIMTGFPDDLKNGRLVWKAINVDEEENEHFIKDYRLHTKSVVIVDMENGVQVRWKNLKDIWDLVDDKKAFIDYIQAETRSYLGKG